ncbi:MAG: hypothetical protein ACRC8S_01100 [Fimbriiglobus sp.]
MWPQLRSSLAKVLSGTRQFPKRLPSPGDSFVFQQMALSPSYRAPHPDELKAASLAPFAIPLPPEERRLLNLVLQSLHDPGPRRDLAAYYTKLHDARGAWILAHLEHPELRPPEAIVHQAEELFAAWSARDLQWSGGLVVGMSLAGRAFLAGAREIMSLCPLAHVRLVAIQPFLEELANCPEARRLESIDLRDNRLGDEGVAKLSDMPFSSWNLAGNKLTGKSLGPILQTAERLDLSRNPLTEISWPKKHFHRLTLDPTIVLPKDVTVSERLAG